MDIPRLLDDAKKKLNVSSDYALAKRLEMHAGLISDYRSGKRIPDDYACFRLALALDRDPKELLAKVKAETAKNEKEAEFWRGFSGHAKRAACLILALSFIGSYAPDVHASGLETFKHVSHNAGFFAGLITNSYYRTFHYAK